MANKCIVLVVEDEVLIRMDLVDRLHGWGCETLEAATATEAISILKRRADVTVVFTDVQCPAQWTVLNSQIMCASAGHLRT